MRELVLFRLQRLSALALIGFVAAHLAGILVFTHRGLSAAVMLGRVQDWLWLYGVFAVVAALHAGIGLRALARERFRFAPRRHARHVAFYAFAAHRVTGLALALFLALHFAALWRLPDAEIFDHALALTAHPLARAGEILIVAALALHLAGGARILAAEFLPGRARGGGRIAASVLFAGAVAAAYALWGQA